MEQAVLRLQQAAESVKQNRTDRVARRDRKRVLDDEYRALFEKLSDFRKSEAGLGFCLLPEEKLLLADYIFGRAETEAASAKRNEQAAGDTGEQAAVATNATTEPPKAQNAPDGKLAARLARILLQDPTETVLQRLYKNSLRWYDAPGIKGVVEAVREDRLFIQTVEKLIKTSPTEILDGIESGMAAMKLCDVAGRRVGFAPYTEILTDLGLEPGYRLYDECIQLFVVVCGAEEYRKIGEQELYTIAEGFDDELRARLLRNMLQNLDSFQLRGFTTLLDIFKSLAGDKGSASYSKTLGGLEAGVLNRYDTWISQYRIRRILGEGERADFWLGYAGKAGVLPLEKQNAILFDFELFKTIEFRNIDAAYFYDKEYFEDAVIDGVTQAKSENDLESFLHDKTEWASQGENLLHWRRAHVRSWQLDMKDYISKNLKKHL